MKTETFLSNSPDSNPLSSSSSSLTPHNNIMDITTPNKSENSNNNPDLDLSQNDRERKKSESNDDDTAMFTILDLELSAWEFHDGTRKSLQDLLSTLHVVLWTGCRWKPISKGDLKTTESVHYHFKKTIQSFSKYIVLEERKIMYEEIIKHKLFLTSSLNTFLNEILQGIGWTSVPTSPPSPITVTNSPTSKHIPTIREYISKRVIISLCHALLESVKNTPN